MVTMSKEYMRNYYLKNKEKYKGKYNKEFYCEHCNSTMKMKHRSRHLKTKKHLDNVNAAQTPSTEAESLRQQIKELVAAVRVLENAKLN